MNIGVIIYTYNRVDDAKINMELIRNQWSKSENLASVKIVHSYNGDAALYGGKYLEDELVMSKNPGHFEGASNLIDEGTAVMQVKFPEVDYVIVLAADTWLVKQDIVVSLLDEMKREQKLLCACSWGNNFQEHTAIVRKFGLSTDFFIYDQQWFQEFEVFPLKFREFDEKFGDFLYYQGKQTQLEKLLMARYIKALKQSDNSNASYTRLIESMRYLHEREPVHVSKNERGNHMRVMHWPELGLLTHHEPEKKKEALKEYKTEFKGQCIEDFMHATDFEYYNNGMRKHSHYDV